MTKELPILDLVRATAAGWVMLAHLTLIGNKPIFLISQGSLGVEVFIFVSGFLMTLILKDEVSLGAKELKRFYVRRFFRIAPSFYLSVVLYLCLRSFFVAGLENAETIFQTPYRIPDLHAAISWRTIFWHASFLHGLFPGEATKIFGPAWSLSLEMQFYLVAPLCVWFLRRRPFVTVATLFAINFAGNIFFGVYGRTGLLATFTFPSFLPNRIFLFAWGGMYCLYLFEKQKKNLVLLVSCIFASLALIGFKNWLVCMCLLAVIHTAVSLGNKRHLLFQRIISSRSIHLLAEWSYGVYLYHLLWLGLVGLVLSRMANLLPMALLWPCYALTVIITAVCFSAALHHLFERPLRTLGRKLSGR